MRLIGAETDLMGVRIRAGGGDALAPSVTDSTFQEFEVAADGSFTVSWTSN